MYLRLIFTDRSFPGSKPLATAEASVNIGRDNGFQITGIPMQNPCAYMEFRLCDRVLDTTAAPALSRPHNVRDFDHHIAFNSRTADTSLMRYLNYMVTNLATEYNTRAEDIRVTGTTYPLNGHFTGTVSRTGEPSTEFPHGEWAVDRDKPYGQQPSASLAMRHTHN